MKKLLLFFAILSCSILYSCNFTWEQYRHHTLNHQSEIPGWCSLEKARNLMELIHATHPKVCVEIGVFGGSSIYPTASALSFLKDGVVYAIDPWSNEECMKGYDENDSNYQWWSQVDFEEVFQGFKNMLWKYSLEQYCKILRMTSKEAADQFAEESIDILHIDGNHSEDQALFDTLTYFPKVKKGGYIWFDDVNWNSTQKAVRYLQEHCAFQSNYSIGNSCYLFKKL